MIPKDYQNSTNHFGRCQRPHGPPESSYCRQVSWRNVVLDDVGQIRIKVGVHELLHQTLLHGLKVFGWCKRFQPLKHVDEEATALVDPHAFFERGSCAVVHIARVELLLQAIQQQ